MSIKAAKLMHYEIKENVSVKKVYYILNTKSDILNERKKKEGFPYFNFREKQLFRRKSKK